jgi:hypothetical protein
MSSNPAAECKASAIAQMRVIEQSVFLNAAEFDHFERSPPERRVQLMKECAEAKIFHSWRSLMVIVEEMPKYPA